MRDLGELDGLCGEMVWATDGGGWSSARSTRQRLTSSIAQAAILIYLIKTMNRLKQYLEDEEPLMPEGDYWIVETKTSFLIVSAETARVIDRSVTRFWRPRWLVFRDLYGARRRLRSELIESLYECTTEQRASQRAFERDRRREDKADRRPWEDYD